MLESLLLWETGVTGTIPTELGGVENLKYLSLCEFCICLLEVE